MGNTAIINPVFALEAGPPVIICELAKIKALMAKVGAKCIDTDVNYNVFINRNREHYDTVQYILGGFPFTYPLNAVLPSNKFPFEELLTGDVILALLYNTGLEEAVNSVCKEIYLDYSVAITALSEFNSFIDLTVEELQNYEDFIFNCTSITSICTTLLLAKKLKKRHVSIKAIGKYLFVPELYKFIQSLGIIDIYLRNYQQLSEYYNQAQTDYDLLDFSDFELDKYNRHLGLNTLELSLCEGCPGKCNFCSIRLEWDEHEVIDKYKILPIESVIKQLKQIESYFGAAFVHINDCTFNSYEPYTIELLDQMKDMNLIYSCNLRADLMTEAIAVKMSEAHFYHAIVGVESLNPYSIQLMNKGNTSYVEKVSSTIKLLLDNNIYPQMNALLFHPEETEKDVQASINAWRTFKKSMKLEGYNYFTAPVGTLCLNYPSKMYHGVITNSNFDIIYHKTPHYLNSIVPLEIQTAYERIPHYALKHLNADEKICDKMTYVKEIYSLASQNNSYTIKSIVSSTSKIAENIAKLWFTNNVKIIPVNNFQAIKNNDDIFLHLKDALSKCIYEFNSICEGLSDKKISKMVVMIVMLNKNKLVEIK